MNLRKSENCIHKFIRLYSCAHHVEIIIKSVHVIENFYFQAYKIKSHQINNYANADDPMPPVVTEEEGN